MSINISVTMAVTVLIALLGLYIGAKKGLADSIAVFVALAVAIIMLGIFLRIFASYSKGDTKQTIISVVILIILGIVYSILKVVTKSVKAIAELPILGFVDKFLGAVLGVALALIIFHAVTAAAQMGYLGKIGDIINKDVAESELLTYLKKLDLIELIMGLKDTVSDKFSQV